MDRSGWGIVNCISCGRCTWGCPLSRRTGDLSPRTFVERYVFGDLPADQGAWSCTSCAMCSHLCDKGVEFHSFMREARKGLRDAPESTHGGVIEVLRGIHSRDWMRPKIGSWISPELDLDPESSTLLFVGCVPYFNVVFSHLRDDLLDIPRSAVTLLNAMGVRPSLLPGERCCGHDAYWKGEEDEFRRLAELNLDAIERAGIQEVVTICPEGYTTLHDLYPRLFGPLGFSVRHILEIISDGVQEGLLSFIYGSEILTYQDPCRLSRHADMTAEARIILEGMGELREMPRGGKMAACCGHSNWVSCDAMTKAWQLERLEEARGTGAELLVTSCPKCLIHLECAQYSALDGGERIMEIEDLCTLAAGRLRID